MKLISFKLFQYEIMENDFRDIWWEMHTAFGQIKRGKCFIRGDILILDIGKFEEPGFLMLEYHERLSRLPIWKKTKYYCQNPSIYSCRIHKKIVLSQLAAQSIHDSDKVRKEQLNSQKYISFRLGKYEVVEMPECKIRWKTFAGYTGIKGGSCFIKEDILFLEPGVLENGKLSKKDFLEHLNELPEWRKTKYYCPYNPLHLCNNETIKHNKCQVNFSDKVLKKAYTEKDHSFKPSMKINNTEEKKIPYLLLKLINFFIKTLFFIVVFFFNFFIELIGIKKK